MRTSLRPGFRKVEGLKLKKKYRGKYVYRPYLHNMHN
jgi:hypothetical protein